MAESWVGPPAVSALVGALTGLAVFAALHGLVPGPPTRQHVWPIVSPGFAVPQETQPLPHPGVQGADQPKLPLSTGWYVHPSDSRFLKLALKSGTDKVTTHNYDTLYAAAFELPPGEPRVQKLLEIGLGCNMGYGPGASAKLWKEMFPAAEVWFAEYDAACVNHTRDKIDALGIHVVLGDQADPTTLRSWVKETGGGFDVIVDDGGHANSQQYASFMALFPHALKPGGLYIIEDLSTSRSPWSGDPSHPTMIDVIKDWLEALMDFDKLPDLPKHAYKPRYLMPPGIRFIQCQSEACAFVKCYPDDMRCKEYSGNLVDPKLPLNLTP